MLSVTEAQQRILERISPLDALELSLADAHGCVLAETVVAPEDLPPTPSAAIDGYAVRSQDTTSAAQTAASLTVVGGSSLGRPHAEALEAGQAVKVAAGAVLPQGADAVVTRDEVAVVGSSMAIGKVVGSGANIRPAGEDLAKGSAVMNEGQRIRGMDVGVLAALGRVRVSIRPRPRVVTFSAGDLPQPEEAQAGLRESNSFAITGMTREAGAEPTRAAPVAAETDALHERFQSYLPQADVFITSGGIGDDADPPIRQAASKLGELEVWVITTRPELLVGIGTVQGRSIFALPSNPVAATIAFELFVRPALLKMAGRRTLHRPEVTATLQDGYEQPLGRETYLRVRAWQDAEGWHARLAGRQDPSGVVSIASSNAYAVLTADRGSVHPGDQVRLILLEPLEGW